MNTRKALPRVGDGVLIRGRVEGVGSDVSDLDIEIELYSDGTADEGSYRTWVHRDLIERVIPASQTPTPPTPYPNVGDWVRVKGTTAAGPVTSVNPGADDDEGPAGSVVLDAPDTDYFWVVPVELIEVIEHSDIRKAAEAIVPLMRDAGAAFGARSIDARRNIVREVLKIVAPDHPALRGRS